MPQQNATGWFFFLCWRTFGPYPLHRNSSSDVSTWPCVFSCSCWLSIRSLLWCWFCKRLGLPWSEWSECLCCWACHYSWARVSNVLVWGTGLGDSKRSDLLVVRRLWREQKVRIHQCGDYVQTLGWGFPCGNARPLHRVWKVVVEENSVGIPCSVTEYPALAHGTNPVPCARKNVIRSSQARPP